MNGLAKPGKNALPTDSLIVLAALRDRRRLGTKTLAQRMQLLMEVSLIAAHSTTRNHSHKLSSGVYRVNGDQTAYTHQTSFTNMWRC